MNAKDFDEKWKDASQKAFDEFIEKEVGLDEMSRPKCYGTGDGGAMCEVCAWKESC